jgi:CBS domain-containing protein
MYEFTYYRAGDVMTGNPITINMDDRILDVERLFEEHDFNGVPVVGSKNNLIGMVTKLDVLKAFGFTKVSKIPRYREIMAERISTIMTKNPYSVHLETPCTRVLNDLITKQIKSIPVVRGSLLIGIIAREDIIHALRLASYGILPGLTDQSEPRASACNIENNTPVFRNFSAW